MKFSKVPTVVDLGGSVSVFRVLQSHFYIVESKYFNENLLTWKLSDNI